MRARGFTLVEVIISVVVLGIVMYALVAIFITSGFQGVNVEVYTVAQALAEDKLEETMALDYSDVTAEGETNFSGELSGYSYEINYDYVSAEALDTAVADDQGYKKIRVLVRHAKLSNPVVLESLRTRY